MEGAATLYLWLSNAENRSFNRMRPSLETHTSRNFYFTRRKPVAQPFKVAIIHQGATYPRYWYSTMDGNSRHGRNSGWELSHSGRGSGAISFFL